MRSYLQTNPGQAKEHLVLIWPISKCETRTAIQMNSRLNQKQPGHLLHCPIKNSNRQMSRALSNLVNLKMWNTNCYPDEQQTKSEAALAICYIAQLRIPIVKFPEHYAVCCCWGDLYEDMIYAPFNKLHIWAEIPPAFVCPHYAAAVSGSQ